MRNEFVSNPVISVLLNIQILLKNVVLSEKLLTGMDSNCELIINI
jgi:hypothetical protein